MKHYIEKKCVAGKCGQYCYVAVNRDTKEIIMMASVVRRFFNKSLNSSDSIISFKIGNEVYKELKSLYETSHCLCKTTTRATMGEYEQAFKDLIFDIYRTEFLNGNPCARFIIPCWQNNDEKENKEASLIYRAFFSFIHGVESLNELWDEELVPTFCFAITKNLQNCNLRKEDIDVWSSAK